MVQNNSKFPPPKPLQTPPRRNPTQPTQPNPMRGVITDEAVKAMQDRNEQRAKEAAERLGTRYVLHRNAMPRQPY